MQKYVIVYPMREESTRLKNKMLRALDVPGNWQNLATIAFYKINIINDLYSKSKNIAEILKDENREVIGAYALIPKNNKKLIDLAKKMNTSYILREEKSESVKEIYGVVPKEADYIVRVSACNPFLCAESIISAIVLNDHKYDSTIFLNEIRDWFFDDNGSCFTNPNFTGTQHSKPIHEMFHGLYIFSRKNMLKDKFFINKNMMYFGEISQLAANAKFYDLDSLFKNIEDKESMALMLESIDVDYEHDFISVQSFISLARSLRSIDSIINDVVLGNIKYKEPFKKTNEYKTTHNEPRTNEWFEKRGFRTTLEKEGRFYQQMIIDTSWNCNLSCKGCNRACDILKKDKYVSIKAVRRLVDDCLNNDIRLKRIYIEGGEPMLHPEIENIVKELSVLSNRFDTKLYMITNGTVPYKHLKKYTSLFIIDSKKNEDDSYIEKFEFFMNAPIDKGVPEAIYERGCTFPYRSGPCLAPDGKIYSCPCAARIVDLFGVKYRAHRKLSRVKLEEFEEQYKDVCKYCGRLKPDSKEDIPTLSWRKIIKEHKNGK